MKNLFTGLVLFLTTCLLQSAVQADEFVCQPNKSGWAVVNKTTNTIIRSGSEDFSYKQDCQRSVNLANRPNSPRVLCTPYHGGTAMTNYAGKNLSPRDAIFNDPEYCFQAVEAFRNNLICIPNGSDLYILGDLDLDKYVLENNNNYRLLSNCIAGASSASTQDSYICAPHVNNQNRHFHIYDRRTGEMLTETSYGKISSCSTDLRGK